jgi:hypothetical protein
LPAAAAPLTLPCGDDSKYLNFKYFQDMMSEAASRPGSLMQSSVLLLVDITSM